MLPIKSQGVPCLQPSCPACAPRCVWRNRGSPAGSVSWRSPAPNSALSAATSPTTGVCNCFPFVLCHASSNSVSDVGIVHRCPGFSPSILSFPCGRAEHCPAHQFLEGMHQWAEYGHHATQGANIHSCGKRHDLRWQVPCFHASLALPVSQLKMKMLGR